MIFLFKYLPRSLGVQLHNYLQQVLPAIIDGLADENESVRDAAYGAGHVLVEYFATTLVLKIPSIWFYAVTKYFILMRMCFYNASCVAGTSGKAHLEGGSDDEGSSTEAHGRAIIEYFEDEEVLDLLSLVPGAQGMEQYLQSLQCLKDEKDSTLGRRIILIIQTLGAASGDVGTGPLLHLISDSIGQICPNPLNRLILWVMYESAEYIHIKQADKDCVLSGIRKMLRRIGASRENTNFELQIEDNQRGEKRQTREGMLLED
nr:eIF-2-alpha kinase activator GCN1 isoform X17 [Ipomoea batatas]